MVGLDNPIHLLFLMLIVLLVFGAKRLPEMGRSLGSGLRGFKESISGETPERPAELGAINTAQVTAEPSEPAGEPLARRADARPAA